MIPTIFKRCLNLILPYVPSAKRGVHGAHSRLGVWFYFIAKQFVRRVKMTMFSRIYPVFIVLFGWLVTMIGFVPSAKAQSAPTLSGLALVATISVDPPASPRYSSSSYSFSFGFTTLLPQTTSQTIRITGPASDGSTQNFYHYVCADKDTRRDVNPQYRAGCRQVGFLTHPTSITLEQTEIDHGGVMWHVWEGEVEITAFADWIPITTSSSVTLMPTFASSTLTYTGIIPSTTNGLKVTPTASSGTIGVSVNSGDTTTVASGSSHTISSLSSGAITVSVIVTDNSLNTTYTATLSSDEVPSFGNNSVPDTTITAGVDTLAWQMPAATGGDGALTYEAIGLPAGLTFDADGSGTCPGAAARTICGTPDNGVGGTFPVTIYATDSDANMANSDRASLLFNINVIGVSIRSTTPAQLTEANLNGARIDLLLHHTRFGHGHFLNASHFGLVTTIPNLSISFVSGGNSDAVFLRLAFTGNFNTDQTLAVRVWASAHDKSGDLTTDTITLTPTPGVTVSESNLALKEDPSTTNANRGTYTVELDTQPANDVVIGVMSNNTDVTVSSSTLTFTNSNWNTAQTVTVTAGHDADGLDDTALVSHRVTTDSGGYTTGLSIASVTVTVDDDETLGMPMNVRVMALMDTLSVNWDAVTGATGYKVQWKSGEENYPTADGHAATHGQATVGSTTNYKIPDLTARTTYAVRVIATRANYDDSEASNEATGALRLLPPKNVSVLAQVDTLRVSWDAVDDADGYKVQWKSGSETYPTSDEQSTTHGQATIAGGSTTTYDISGLTAGTTYAIRVIATRANVADSDPSAEQTGVPLLGSPTGVEVSATADTLTVTWNAVDDATGYKVQWKSGSETYPTSDLASATRGQATIANGSTTTYDISGLTAGTTYAIRVIATRANVADSDPSDEVTDVPLLGSPTGVEVSATADTLTVTWNAVDDAIGYKVQWKSGSETYPTSDLVSALRGQATIADGSTTTYDISGLTAETTYTIRVIATHTTTAANSTPSDAVMVTTAPAKPTNVRVTPGPLQLIVRWTEATGARGYKVQWKSGGQSYNTSDRQATVSGGNTTTYTIENLTIGTIYTVRVIATLAGGMDSDPSDEVMGTPQRIDYDSDGDGLIDITTLAQLNAIRWDLNGDGVVAASDTMNYNAAFPNRDTTSNVRMGCPSGTCTGYELFASLDFDENGDGDITQTGDPTYWNSGMGWNPIGTFSTQYQGDFKGNGHTINNLFINRGNVNSIGLFGDVDTGVQIETVGVTNADVTGALYTGILVGSNSGTIVACYTTGSVTGTDRVGGIVGYQGRNAAVINSSYSTAAVSGNNQVGGVLGQKFGSVTNSYSTGRVSGSSNVGGLIGSSSQGSTTNSYWDTSTSDRATSGGGGTGKTTSELQSPTTYGATANDTYYGWDADLDGQSGNDDPWTFGAMNQYPVLKYAGMDTTVQFQLQPAIVTLALTPSSISENGGMSTVTATLAHPLSAATTIIVRPVAGAYTVAADSTITIAAGSTANASDTVVITAVDNTQDAPNRDVTVTVVADNAQAVFLSTVITITDDDAPPRLSISSPSAVEGTALTFTVRLHAASGKEVTVAYADAGTGTATSGTDYTALTAGTLTFAAGTTSQTIAVSVSDDSDDEPNETVEVTLSNAVNATFDGGATSLTGTGTIIDDDGMPALSIGSPSVIEGATGATLTFQVYLRPAHTAQVTVGYADAGTGTATSGTDYTALTAGTLTFAMGDTIQTIPVSVTDDSNDEQNETVIVTLSSATNATISTAQGTGTIIDDETSSANLDVDGDGRVRLFSDIILVIRYVLFFRNEALLRGNVIEPTATRTTAQEIQPYLDTLVNQNILDVDGDGDVRLFSDIILIIRYVLFFRNEALLRGNVIEQNATRTTAQAIEPYIRSLYPDSHFQ